MKGQRAPLHGGSRFGGLRCLKGSYFSYGKLQRRLSRRILNGDSTTLLHPLRARGVTPMLRTWITCLEVALNRDSYGSYFDNIFRQWQTMSPSRYGFTTLLVAKTMCWLQLSFGGIGGGEIIEFFGITLGTSVMFHGSSWQTLSAASADTTYRWFSGAFESYGASTTFMVELLAVELGLHVCWDLGCARFYATQIAPMSKMSCKRRQVLIIIGLAMLFSV